MDFQDIMNDAVAGNSNIADYVRKLVTSSMDPKAAAEELCADLSAWRGQAEDWVRAHEDDDVVKERRKSVNNVVGYMVRVFRDATGLTIKCTQRKPCYVYQWSEAKENSPEGKSEEMSEEADIPIVTASCMDKVKQLTAEYGLYEVAEAVAMLIKEKEDRDSGAA